MGILKSNNPFMHGNCMNCMIYKSEEILNNVESYVFRDVEWMFFFLYVKFVYAIFVYVKYVRHKICRLEHFDIPKLSTSKVKFIGCLKTIFIYYTIMSRRARNDAATLQKNTFSGYYIIDFSSIKQCVLGINPFLFINVRGNCI